MARLNLSHGNMKSNIKLLGLYGEAKRLRPHKCCALLVDIRGREIRISNFKQEQQFLEFAVEDVCVIKCDEEGFGSISDNEAIRVDCPYLPKVLRPTDIVYMNGGKLRAEVIDVTEMTVKIRFKEAGLLPPNSQMRLQGAKYEAIPILNIMDMHDLKAIYEKYPYEYVSIPVVQEAKDLHEFRLAIGNEIA